MYKSNKLSSFDIMYSIEDSDIYNSYALELLDTTVSANVKLNRISTDRLDLVSKNIYKSTNYENYIGVLGILNRVTDEDYLESVNYISTSQIDKLTGV